jgi:hypothetical protein
MWIASPAQNGIASGSAFDEKMDQTKTKINTPSSQRGWTKIQ